MRKELHLLRETHRAEGAFQRYCDVSVSVDKLRVPLFGQLNCTFELAARGRAGLFRNLFLVAREHELSCEKEEFFLLEDVENIGLFILFSVFESLHSVFIELDGDDIGVLLVDDILDELHGIA